MSIRILGGSYRGRVLSSVPGQATRPLMGQAKQALFNILAGELSEARVWDLFAGTGATGIEALSRGAGSVLFVERAQRALEVLRANLTLLGPLAAERSQVIRGNAWNPSAREDPPDLIFVDPPYEQVRRDPTGCLAHVETLQSRLADGGCLVFHFPKGVLCESNLRTLGELDLRHFGGAALALLRPGA